MSIADVLVARCMAEIKAYNRHAVSLSTKGSVGFGKKFLYSSSNGRPVGADFRSAPLLPGGFPDPKEERA
jgi:hypothetical protein